MESEKEYIQRRHVGTKENPADLGSRSGQISECFDLWWHGPSWLPYPDNWLENIVTTSTEETKAEAKSVRGLFGITVTTDDQLDLMMRKWNLWKAIRICSWVARFIWNSRTKRQQRITGPITTEATIKQLQSWARRSQVRSLSTTKFDVDKLQLNLQKNAAGLFECRGRIRRINPIYLLDGAVLTEKLVMHPNSKPCMGELDIREHYWVPRLTSMTKRVKRSCYGCKRYQITALANPPTESLSKDRTEGSVPFKFIGVDFGGPVKYLNKSKGGMKAYIVLYTCCLTQAVYLEILPNLSVKEFNLQFAVRSLKRLIARRGRPEKIFSGQWENLRRSGKEVEEDKE